MNTLLKENSAPLIVGITGGIGSGKTTIAKIFESIGVPVFYSDNEAKNILNTNDELKKQIIALFGDVYDEKGLNKKKIADLVFKDKTKLEKLNKLVHPKVKERFNDWISKNRENAFLLKEAAILIETGAYKELDVLILIEAPDEIKINRVMDRDRISKSKILERISKQLTDTEKRKFANYIINNDGNTLIIPQVLKIYEKLKSRN